MLGRTATDPTKRGPHRPENVGQQQPVRASLWRVATFKSSLGAARHSLAYIPWYDTRLPNSEGRI